MNFAATLRFKIARRAELHQDVEEMAIRMPSEKIRNILAIPRFFHTRITPCVQYSSRFMAIHILKSE
jgi:hypothetical protein